MNEQDRLLIEQYFCQELTEAERQSVEQRLASDPAFRAEALLHEKAIGAIRLRGRVDVKKRLAGRPMKRRWGSVRWVFALGLFLLALAAWWMWPPHSAETPAPAPRPSVLPPADPPLAPAPAPSSPAPPVVAPKNIPAAEVFASAFQPYTEASLQIAVRDNGPSSPLNAFLQSYIDGQYKKAIADYELLPAALKDAPKTQLLLANALLASRQPARAAASLATLSQSASSKYASEARWYLALSQLALNKLSRAKEELERIGADASSKHQAEARDLLKKLR